MSRKQKKDIVYIINGFIILGGLYLIFTYSLDWYYLVGLILIATIISGAIATMIPSKKTGTKKRNQSIQKNTSIKKQSGIRSENKLLKLPLSELNWEEFEELCYLYYKAKNMNPRKTKKGADGGVDLIVYSKQHRADIAIQIKHWTKKVTVKEIRELHSAKRNYNLVLADFISSSGYTTEALKEADRCKINAETAYKLEKWREQQVKKKKYA